MVFAEASAFGADGDGETLKKNRFLSTTKEVEDLNQYWYSNRTIAHMARDVEDVCAEEGTRWGLYKLNPVDDPQLGNRLVSTLGACNVISWCQAFALTKRVTLCTATPGTP
jgi:hypothetical protein